MIGHRHTNRLAGTRVLVATLVLIMALATHVSAQRGPTDLLEGYSAITLAATCMEGDNDSRRGVEAERECEQYIRGFLDALGVMQLEQGETSLPQLCLPAEIDALDAVRRSYTRWVFQNFEQRNSPAGVMLMQSLQEEFSCP